MTRLVKSLQWNIGAGRIRAQGADPLAAASYNLDGLRKVIELLRAEDPDIITLQEAHAGDGYNQVEMIAAMLGYAYSVSDFFSESHIEAGQRLGQGIISKFPISEHSSQVFINPRFEVIWKDGSSVTSHDKGITSCLINIDGASVATKTLHLVPFEPFKVDPGSDAAKPLFADVQQKLLDSHPQLLVQGDLNLGRLNERADVLMPDLSNMGLEELASVLPTMPNGQRPDRILYKGIEILGSRVLNTVLTDHYPVVVTFETMA